MKFHYVIYFLVLVFTLTILCCGSDDTDETGTETPSSVSISGILTTTANPRIASPGSVSVNAITDYKIYCTTFEETPVAKSGDVTDAGNGNGNYTVADLPTNVAFGCFVINKTTNGVVGTIVFTDSSSVSGASKTTSFATSTVSDINITLNTDTGIATASIPETVTRATANDTSNTNNLDTVMKYFTGAFSRNCNRVVSRLDLNVNTSLAIPNDGPCSAGGSSMYLNIVKMTSTDGKDYYGVASWQSQEIFVACGSTEGLNNISDAMNINTAVRYIDNSNAMAPYQWDNFNNFAALDLGTATEDQINTAIENDIKTMVSGYDTYVNNNCSGNDNGVCVRSFFYNTSEFNTIYQSGVCWPNWDNIFDGTSWKFKIRPVTGSKVDPKGRPIFLPLEKTGKYISGNAFKTETWNEYDSNTNTSFTCYKNEHISMNFDITQITSATQTTPITQYLTFLVNYDSDTAAHAAECGDEVKFTNWSDHDLKTNQIEIIFTKQ